MKASVKWPTFPYPEYRARVKRAQQCLEQHGLGDTGSAEVVATADPVRAILGRADEDEAARVVDETRPQAPAQEPAS